LAESLLFEEKAIEKYHELLKLCGNNIALEELARDMIRKETEHIEEVQKMLLVP
jgi:bacterioferritin